MARPIGAGANKIKQSGGAIGSGRRRIESGKISGSACSRRRADGARRGECAALPPSP